MKIYKALIVEDEINAQEALTKIIDRFIDSVEVVGIVSSVKDAVSYINTNVFDILFLDIELPDGLGLDVLDQTNFNGHVIFTTAYDNYSIDAIKRSAFDYLLKPISIKELRETIVRLKNKSNTDITLQIENLKHPNKLALADMEGINIVDIIDIIRCESEKNYTTFYLTSGKKLVISKTMGEFEDILSKNGLMRVQKSHIVNLKFVVKFIKSDGGKLLLKNGDLVKVSVTKKDEVLQKLME